MALTLQENGMATLVGERSAGEAIDHHVLYPNRQLVLLMADIRLLSSKKGGGMVQESYQIYRFHESNIQR